MRVFPRLFGLVAASPFFVAPAAMAFVTFDHGRLVGTGSARVDYDSNIFVSHSQVSDTIGTATGGIDYQRDAGIVTCDVGLGFTTQAFAQHSNQNTTDPYLTAQMGYAPSDKTNLHADLDYRRNTIANELVNARTESDDLNFNSTLEYLGSEKLGLRATAGYFQSNYLTPGYSDVGSDYFGAYGVYIYSPKLKLLSGVTATDSWTKHRANSGLSPDNTDWRYTVGAEGELAPKVTGNVNVGVTRRSFKNAGFQASSDLYLSAQLNWAAAEKTTWSLVAARSLTLTAADQSAKTFTTELRVVQVLAEKLTGEAAVGWEAADYQSFRQVGNRNDDGYTVRGRLTYTVNDAVSCDLSAGYRNSHSNLLISTYDRVNAGAGVTVRF